MKHLYYILPIILLTVILSLSYTGLRSEIPSRDLIGVKYTIEKNGTIISILRKSGIEKSVRDSIISYLSQETDLRKCMPGEKIYIYTDSKMNFKKLEYHKSTGNILLVEKDRIYSVGSRDSEHTLNIVYLEGNIRTNLYSELLSRGETGELVRQFAKIFAWQFDFNSNIQSNYKYEVMVEKHFVNNEFSRYGRILYASFETDKRLYEAFFYNDENIFGYYDKDGNRMEGYIMKAPLAQYARISSGYTSKRFHPVMKKYYPHWAIDYASPKNTPVYAAADGQIIHRFYDRYGGNSIIIKHANGYETEYMHLNKFERNMVEGRFVNQGDVIGYVGRTGIATGYHLHFAVKRNGTYVNPRRLQFKKQNDFTEKKLEQYAAYREVMHSLIFAAKSFSKFPDYCSRKQYFFEYARITH